MIYNSMTLLFARSRNWGNAYVFAALDVVFAILWLSAFAAVAAWTNHGYCFGACSLSKAMAGVGFFVLYVSYTFTKEWDHLLTSYAVPFGSSHLPSPSTEQYTTATTAPSQARGYQTTQR